MLDELTSSLNLIVQQTKTNIPYLVDMLALLWGMFLLNQVLGKRLLYLGIVPRKPLGLIGIIFAPFLHANAEHLFYNCIPLVVLSNFLLINGLHYFLIITLILMLLSGLLTWCFAKSGIHVGASAVVTGYWGLLVGNIYQQGTVTAIILGIICVYYFAGILLSVLPGKKGVSWQGHLFGLISGLLLSYALNVV